MWHVLEHTLANCVNACYHGNGKKITECTHTINHKPLRIKYSTQTYKIHLSLNDTVTVS